MPIVWPTSFVRVCDDHDVSFGHEVDHPVGENVDPKLPNRGFACPTRKNWCRVRPCSDLLDCHVDSVKEIASKSRFAVVMPEGSFAEFLERCWMLAFFQTHL